MQSDTTGSLQKFHKILEEAGKKGASDIHYVPKEQLLLRIDGRLVDMTEEWNVSFSMEELIEELLDKKQQKTFEENGEVEFSCPVFNRRVRVNLFRQSIFSGAESPWCCSGRSALTAGLMKQD